MIETLVHTPDGLLKATVPWWLTEGTKVELVAAGGPFMQTHVGYVRGVITNSSIKETKRSAQPGYFFANFKRYDVNGDEASHYGNFRVLTTQVKIID